MRSAAAVCVFGCLAGCSLALNEPQAFSAEDADSGTDARAPDGSTDALPGPDGPPPDAWMPRDRYVPPDMVAPDGEPDGPAVVVDAGPDAAPDASCEASEEVCDGVDNDCDDAVDEAFPGQCDFCGAAGRQGVCAVGAFVCIAGQLRCESWLPDPGTEVACDLIDNDCDGVQDEAGEAVPQRTPEQQAVVVTCGDRANAVAPPARDDCDHADPRRVGCGAPHPCVAPGCSQTCEDDRETSEGACGADCPNRASEVEQAECWGDCAEVVERAYLGCMNRCRMAPQAATRWSCTGGDGGPTCQAIDCPEGQRPAGLGCEENVEVCNNGLDDDDDGLVDGTLDGDDPCMAGFDQRAGPGQQGLCPDPGVAGCEDSARVRGEDGPGDSTCLGGPCPRMVDLSYPFALDREEVSVRAYASCVANGCCVSPTGRQWALADQLLAGEVLPRAGDVDRCAEPPRIGPGDAAVLDLPVTGVSWCQARDYCAWVGKRLATEYEWERAAMGVGRARRTYAWGDDAPALCSETQCCRAEGFEGDQPGVCEGGLPVCPSDPPNETRLACLATYNFDEQACAPFAGVAPVYSNADGATPEGLLNMTGNVTEWVYDWDGAYAFNDTSDPVGAACDRGTFPNKRMTRGQAYTSTIPRMRLVDRNPLFDSTRAPVIGFRCARTVTDDGDLCQAQVPRVPEVCQRAAPACAAPDFVGSSALERTTCDGLAEGREATDCIAGLANYCAAPGQTAGCGSYLISRLRLPPVLFDDPEVSGILNTVLEADLAPGGGATIFALSVPEDFGIEQSREWNASIGSATVSADGELGWLGELDGDICARSEVLDFTLRTIQGSRALPSVCRAVGAGRLSFRSAPVSLAFTGFGMQASLEPAADLMRGTLILVATLADLRESRFGEVAFGAVDLQDRFERLGLRAENLCGQPVAFLECLQQPLLLQGCDGNECMDPDTCHGFQLPFEFEAVKAPADVVGLDACDAE